MAPAGAKRPTPFTVPASNRTELLHRLRKDTLNQRLEQSAWILLYLEEMVLLDATQQFIDSRNSCSV